MGFPIVNKKYQFRSSQIFLKAEHFCFIFVIKTTVLREPFQHHFISRNFSKVGFCLLCNYRFCNSVCSRGRENHAALSMIYNFQHFKFNFELSLWFCQTSQLLLCLVNFCKTISVMTQNQTAFIELSCH